MPLSFPFLVGPISMITSMLIFQSHSFVITITAIIIVFISVWISFHYLNVFQKVLGDLVYFVIAKIRYVFIIAVAVRFIMEGTMKYLKP